MPFRSFDFSDQLSEDWISQPRSSEDVPLPSPEPFKSSVHHSRIPLPTKVIASLAQGKDEAPGSSRPSPRPLHAKSKSEFSIPHRTGGKGRSEQFANHDMQRSNSNHQRSTSAQSWTTDGTIQRFGTEARTPAVNGPMTPEWKRRLLRGHDSHDAKDLFSPIGLEGMFRPPLSPKQHVLTTSPKNRRFQAENNETSTIYPSSPPICPRSQRRRNTNKSISPTPSHKRHSKDQCNGQGGKCEGATRMPTSAHKRAAERRKAKEEGIDREKDSELSQLTHGEENSSMLADHESISPVTISRGRIDYKSIQASVLHLRHKMAELGMREQERPTSRSSDHGVSYFDHRVEVQALGDGSLNPSLQENELLVRDDAFIGVRRGRRAKVEGSLLLGQQSSVRGLMRKAPEEETAAQGISQTSDLRSPPHDSRQIKSSPIKPSAGGSPLKLFGKHDTFTNNHLMRRLSQYATKGTAQASERSWTPPSPSPQRSLSGTLLVDKSRPLSRRFGNENLKTYQFLGSKTAVFNQLDDDEEPSLPPVLPPKQPVKFQVPRRQELNPSRRVSRIMFKRMSEPYATRRRPQIPSLAEFRKSIEDSDVRNDGKRAMPSPGKNHQAKRRRTLLRSIGSPEASSPESPAPRLVIGKKRKEAFVPEEAANASTNTLASRTMLRPRSYSAHLSSATSSPMSSWLGAASSRHTSHPAQSIDTVDHSTKILAEDLATFALNVAQSITKGERKASVTTADFFKEATMIMKRLRGQPLSVSGRTSRELSTVEPLPEIAEDELVCPQNDRSHRHLQISSKDGAAESESVRASKLAANHGNPIANDSLTDRVCEQSDRADLSGNYGGDLPESDFNVRILNHQHGDYAIADIADEPVQTQSSTNLSLSRSLRTGSSTNSSKKFNIAPETVKDLISNQVGRMTFDHEKKTWIRSRAMSFQGPDGLVHPSSEVTEEDPLRSIPDLRDEISPTRQYNEQSNLCSDNVSNGTVVTKSKDAKLESASFSHSKQALPENEDRPSSGHGGDSSQLSKLSKFGSSQAAPDTRATSWSTLPSTKIQGAATEPDLPQVREATETPPRDILPSDQGKTAVKTTKTFRHSAVAFSSPLTTVPDEVLFDRAKRDGNTRVSSPPDQSPVKQHKVAIAIARNKDRAKRHLSVVKQRYTDRPISRIDENEEHSNANISIKETANSSLVLVTPQRYHQPNVSALSTQQAPSSRHSSVAFHKTLHLDFLSEFTIHQADESLDLDVNYVRQRHNLASDAEIDTHFSLAVQDLIAKVTDIEPFEPHWEYISRINLNDKKLTTLHMLEEFCPRVQDLNVDDNELGQVNGAPEMLTSISIQNNFLTSVTSWGHLVNLQYLDASGNQIDNLKSFEGLVHLRELTLRDNQISTLDGLENLRGLIKLRLSRNCVTTVDLQNAELTRLVELDLSENQIGGKPIFGTMPSLEILNLHTNRLEALGFKDSCHLLRSLDLGKNRINSLDVSDLSQLYQLNIDCNELAFVKGLDSLRRLSFLSWRAQSIHETATIDLMAVREVQSLALSGNKIDLFQLGSAILFNLQSLDLSCCGLDSLPQEFGRLVPNLKRINLNYNALRDIKPLLGVKSLQELHIAGNRILRLRNTANVLAKLGKQLVSLDFRTNPLTLGFYASNGGLPVASSRSWDVQDSRAITQTARDVDAERYNAAAVTQRQDSSLQDENAQDKSHRERLDEGTMLRRRVYELLILNHCPLLESLDGTYLGENAIYRGSDGVWDRLIELGVVKMQLPAPPEYLTSERTYQADGHLKESHNPNPALRRFEVNGLLPAQQLRAGSKTD